METPGLMIDPELKELHRKFKNSNCNSKELLEPSPKEGRSSSKFLKEREQGEVR